MRMRMGESKFGAPVGVYQAKFLGVAPLVEKPGAPPRVGADGKPMGPAYEWQFEVVGGEYAGKIVSRITAQNPTSLNSCGTLLKGVVGRAVNQDEDIDLDPYRGRLYQVVVGPSRNNPDRTQVAQVLPGTVAAPAAAAPGAPKGPPPPKAAPAPPANPPLAMVWLWNGEQPVKMTRVDVQNWIAKEKHNPRDVQVATPENPDTWVSAEALGFTDQVPF